MFDLREEETIIYIYGERLYIRSKEAPVQTSLSIQPHHTFPGSNSSRPAPFRIPGESRDSLSLAVDAAPLGPVGWPA